MNKTFHMLLIGMVIMAALVGQNPTLAQAQPSPSTLLQQAIFAEETEGDTEAAISIYETIIEETTHNQSVSAQALFRIGFCYKRIGNTIKAQDAFRRLIREHRNEAQLIERAIKELPQIKHLTQAQRIQHINSLNPDWHPLAVSFDERLVACTQPTNPEVILLFDLNTLKTKSLTLPPAIQSSNCRVLFSPKTTNIAYFRRFSPNQVWLASTSNQDQRMIWSDENSRFWPKEWLGGSNRIAGFHINESKTYLSLLDPDTGHMEDLIILKGPHLIEGIRFNQKEDKAVYIELNQKLHPELWVYHRNTKKKQKLSAPGLERIIGWEPTYDRVLYLSSASGDMAINATPLHGGKIETLSNHLGDLYPTSISKEGTLFFLRKQSNFNIYVADIDRESGELIKHPRQLTERFAGYQYHPFWAPDGTSLGYCLNHPRLQEIRISDLRTGDISSLYSFRDTGVPFAVDWLPAKNKMVLETTSHEIGIGLLDILTGKMASLARSTSNSEIYQTLALDPKFSSTQDSVFYYRHQWPPVESESISRKIIEINLEDNSESEFLDLSNIAIYTGGQEFAVTGDKSKVVVQTKDQQSSNLTIVDVTTKSRQLAYELPGNSRIQSMDWDPQGSHIIATLQSKDSLIPIKKMILINSISNQVKTIEIDLPFPKHVSFHPNGRTIAFQAGQELPSTLWGYENLLKTQNSVTNNSTKEQP